MGFPAQKEVIFTPDPLSDQAQEMLSHLKRIIGHQFLMRLKVPFRLLRTIAILFKHCKVLHCDFDNVHPNMMTL